MAVVFWKMLGWDSWWSWLIILSLTGQENTNNFSFARKQHAHPIKLRTTELKFYSTINWFPSKRKWLIKTSLCFQLIFFWSCELSVIYIIIPTYIYYYSRILVYVDMLFAKHSCNGRLHDIQLLGSPFFFDWLPRNLQKCTHLD